MKNRDTTIGGVGILFVLASLIWYSIANLWQIWHWILLIFGVAGLGYFLFIFFTKRQKELSARSLKYGSNVLLQVVIVLVIIGLLAFVTTRRHFRSDLTKNNLYSLSDQTVKLVTDLKRDVVIKAFFKKAEQNAAKDLLDEYDFRSGKLIYDLIDPDERPEIAKQYGIKKYNTLTVESGVKRETVEDMSESNLTNAIIKVTREQDKVIYFLTGHGEHSINDDASTGYKKAVEAIRKENHLVRELNLVRRRSVPDSCNVLAIVGPKSNFFPGELDSIKNFIDHGGKALIMLDPESPADIAQFMANYKVTVRSDMVIDVSGMGQLFGAGPGMPLVTSYNQDHVITKGFNVMTFYPYACSVTPQSDKGDFTITSLFSSSENSWAEADYTSGQVSFDPAQDVQGPVTLAVVVQKDLAQGKSALALFGDSDFAQNGYFNQQGNVNLFLNTVNFLAEEEDLISIRPKELDDRRLTMTQADVSGLFYLVVIAIPVLVIIMGVVVYIKRNRG